MRYIFGDYSYSICLWGLQAGWLVGFMGLLCIYIYCMHYFCLMTILVNLSWHLLILENLTAWASLDGNCGKFDQANLIFFMMLPVDVVWCMLGEYRVFPHLAAIIVVACLLQGVADGLREFLPIYLAGLGRDHQDSGAGCPYWWLHGPIHPKYVIWVCSLAILRAAPSFWRCPAEGNQGLPEHSEVWRCRLGSDSYPRNAAWQMARKFFTKCPSRAHRWGICRGAQEAIGHHWEKLPRRVPNHHKLGPYKPGTFAGSVHQVNDVA